MTTSVYLYMHVNVGYVYVIFAHIKSPYLFVQIVQCCSMLASIQHQCEETHTGS